MTPEEYRREVKVLIVPTGASAVGAPVTSFTTFQLRTSGMAKFGKADLQIRKVPPMFVDAAGRELNHWGYHFASTDAVLTAGQTLSSNLDGPMPVLLKAVPAGEWQGNEMLQLVVIDLEFRCGGRSCACDEHRTVN